MTSQSRSETHFPEEIDSNTKDKSLQGSSALPELQDNSIPAAPTKRGIVAANRILAVISRTDVLTAYAALTVIFLGQAFAEYSQSTYTAYATSAFKSHSQLAAAGVVQRVFAMIGDAILPKVMDNVGRISPTLFALVIASMILSDALMAGCRIVQTYIGASVFAGLSNGGTEVAFQIYIAETTNIVNRAFWNVLGGSLSSIIALYSGSEIGGLVLSNWGVQAGWRWGYGMWCIIMFVLSIPFIAIVTSWHVRAAKRTDLAELPPRGSIMFQLFHEYDIIGMSLLVGGLALVLVPLSLARGISSAWDGENVAMIVTGFVLVTFFVIWSLPDKYRPAWLFTPKYPHIPWYTLKNPSVLGMFIVNMFDFMSYAVFTIYFVSYLQVAVRVSPASATQIDNTLRIVFQVIALVVGALMRWWTPICIKLVGREYLFHTRWPIWAGVLLCTLASGLNINFVQHPRRGSAVASFVLAKAVYGTGRALTQTSAQVAIQAAAHRGELAMATGIFYFAMSLGGAIGVSVAGAVWNNTLPEALAANLPADSAALASRIFGSIATAISHDPESDIGVAIMVSYKHTMKILAIISTCLQIPMLIAMLFVQDIVLTENEQDMYGSKRLALVQRKRTSDAGSSQNDKQ